MCLTGYSSYQAVLCFSWNLNVRVSYPRLLKKEKQTGCAPTDVPCLRLMMLIVLRICLMDLILENYQEVARDFILDTPDCALFLDCGLGKTAITLAAVTELLDQVDTKGILVVAPLRVARLVWPMEIEKWDAFSWMSVSFIHGNNKLEKLKSGAAIYTINYEGLIWLADTLRKVKPSKWPFDTIVWDELTKMKAHSTHRFKRIKALIPYFKRHIGLTGTPIPNGHMDLFGQFYVLDGGKRLGTAFNAFQQRYFMKADYMGYKYKPQEGAIERLNAQIADITLRMSAEQYLDLIPPVVIDVELVLPSDKMAVYKRLEKELFITLDSGVDVEVFNAAALTNKCLQYAGGSVYTNDKHEWESVHDVKHKALDKIVQDNKHTPIIIAYSFVHEAHRIMKTYPEAVWLRSGLSDTAERELQNAWDAGEIPILVCHPGSAGHGLNLQYGGSTIIWFGLSWSLELYIQLNKRVDRKGQLKTPTIYRLITRDTIEEVVASVLEMKEDNQTQLLRALQLYRDSK
jgi:SNF2 family DNA or RNA helicase